MLNAGVIKIENSIRQFDKPLKRRLYHAKILSTEANVTYKTTNE